MTLPIPSSSQIDSNPLARAYWQARILYYSQRDSLETIHPEEYLHPKGIAKVSFFGLRIARINSPHLVHAVLVENHRKLVKGKLFDRILGPSLGQGLLTIEGDVWKRHRKLINPAFHHAALKNVAGILDVRAAQAVEKLDTWLGNKPAKVLDINTWTSTTTMDLVMRALFSSDLAGRERQLSKDIAQALQMLSASNLLDLVGAPDWMPRRSGGKRLRTLLVRSQNTLMQVLDARLNAPAGVPHDTDPVHGDLLDLLLAHKIDQDTMALSPDELRDEILTMFAAGHETTALSLAWALQLLAQHPEIQDQAAACAKTLVHDPAISWSKLQGNTILHQVFNESLRLYPPAFVLIREAVEDIWVDGPQGPVMIDAGTTISIPITVIHRHPDHWLQPNRFDPSRFTPENQTSRHQTAFMPFGAGPRVCIGKHFATMEGVLVLAHFLARFSVKALGQEPPKAVGRITTRPAQNIRLVLSKRN